MSRIAALLLAGTAALAISGGLIYSAYFRPTSPVGSILPAVEVGASMAEQSTQGQFFTPGGPSYPTHTIIIKWADGTVTK
jgi:hypothetical protein